MEKHFEDMHKLFNECMDAAVKRLTKRRFEDYESYPLAVISMATAIFNLKTQELQARFQIKQRVEMLKMQEEAMKKQPSKLTMAEIAETVKNAASKDKDCSQCGP